MQPQSAALNFHGPGVIKIRIYPGATSVPGFDQGTTVVYYAPFTTEDRIPLNLERSP